MPAEWTVISQKTDKVTDPSLSQQPIVPVAPLPAVSSRIPSSSRDDNNATPQAAFAPQRGSKRKRHDSSNIAPDESVAVHQPASASPAKKRLRKTDALAGPSSPTPDDQFLPDPKPVKKSKSKARDGAVPDESSLQVDHRDEGVLSDGHLDKRATKQAKKTAKERAKAGPLVPQSTSAVVGSKVSKKRKARNDAVHEDVVPAPGLLESDALSIV